MKESRVIVKSFFMIRGIESIENRKKQKQKKQKETKRKNGVRP